MIDTLSQILIFTLPLLSFWMIARGNRWGFVVGILAQPAWFYEAVRHEQWGMFCLAMVYTLIHLDGFYREFIRKENK